MVVINLLAPNAISLHVDEMVDADQHVGSFSANVSGTKTARRGATVELRPGRNEVDADFWSKWSEQNKGSGLLGLLREQKEE